MDTPEHPARFRLPEGRTPGAILGALRGAGYASDPSPRSFVRRLYLDSQGGLLAKSGARLALDREGDEDRWLFAPACGPPVRVPAGPVPDGWPLRPGGPDLPEGARLALGGAGLFPAVGVDLHRREAVLTAASGARLLLVFETLKSRRALRGADAAPVATTVLTIWPLEGDPGEAGHAEVYLRDRLGLIREDRDACALALAAAGRPEPGGHAPEALRVAPGDRLALAARKIVAQQVLKVRANAEGTLLDRDPEYLHDLRVATRRLRSALRLFAPALGPKRAESLRIELGWMGRVLGEVRDLDVFIGGLEGHAPRLGEAGRVALRLKAELESRRVPAREALVSALSSRRFSTLLRRLETLAGSPVPKRLLGVAALPAEATGPLFIGPAHRRVVKQGRAAVPAGDAAALHRLRILFKRLRYASEFLAPAMGGRLEPMIRAMVRFQDCLGEHQDAIVAARRTEALAREMAARGALPVEALLDLGGLIQVEREIAAARRKKLGGLWARFDRRAVRRCLSGAGDGVPPLKPSIRRPRKDTP